MWTNAELNEAVYNFSNLNNDLQNRIKEKLNSTFSYSDYLIAKDKREKAIKNREKSKNILNNATQEFPSTLSANDIKIDKNAISKFAIVITAGGEGERLRESLKKDGYTEEELTDFTKATWPIPNEKNNYGALQVTLSQIKDIEKRLNITIPIIVTTGPKGTTTDRVIPQIIKDNNNFGLNILIISQNERRHLTTDNKIAWIEENSNIKIASNPDESGGPLMKLLDKSDNNKSAINWIEEFGKTNIMVLQGTAVYNPILIEKIATAGLNYDGMGVGIARNTFPSDDPYGTYVLLNNNGNKKLNIIEIDVRNSETENLKSNNGEYLPYNTGFYTFEVKLLKDNPLPDYASPKKIIFEGYDKSEKIGYAATDIIIPAKNPGVLTISGDDFAVLKNSNDLDKLSAVLKKL